MIEMTTIYDRDGNRKQIPRGAPIPDGWGIRTSELVMDGHSVGDAGMAVYDTAFVAELPRALAAYGLAADDGSPAAIAARGKARLAVLQNAGAVLVDAARQRMVQSYGSRPNAADDAQSRAAVADAQRVNDAAYDWFRTRTTDDSRLDPGAERARAAYVEMVHHLNNAWKGSR